MTISRRTAIAALTSAVAVAAAPGAALADVAAPDPGALDAALAGLPSDEASAALAKVKWSGGGWVGSSGLAGVREKHCPIHNSRFRIGSMTKTFTAVLVLQLAAEGRVDLDAPVQRYLPGLLPLSYAPVPVRSLLNWTSGLNGVEIDSKDPAWFFAHRYDHWEPGTQLDVSKPLAFAPGTTQRYGNADYIVAGLLVERICGLSWAATMRRRIIGPLGLSGTSMPGDDPEIHGPHAHGYEATAGGWVDVTAANPSLQWSAASMISTLDDLDRFVVALFRGRLLPPAQLAEMFTVPDVPLFGSTSSRATYSAGLTRTAIGGATVWAKSGDRPGYNNVMAATRDLDRRLVYSVNTLHMGADSLPLVAEKLAMATFA